ncbi:MAG: adenosylmethionine decarboxylase [Bacteriovoracaceae bacterium]
MAFEGSEKKIEIIVNESINLRVLGDKFWKDMVAKCEATILSKISNNSCDAYLLSESSLFVWDHKFLMITCGRTILANSVLRFFEDFGAESVDGLFFQRKNEYFERLQPSSFFDDVDKIGKLISGKALRFGHLDTHHTHLFHSEVMKNIQPEDKTTELLMYHLTGRGAEVFRTENQNIEAIRGFFDYDNLFPGFEIDDFLFEPFGFSLNGIKEDKYITIHITPEQSTSYISFETNLDIEKEAPRLLDKILELFSPEAFDIINFNSEVAPRLEDNNLQCIKKYKHSIDRNLDINYYEFHKIQTEMNKAIEVKR